ncbi:hypothetical protein EQM14_15080 [Caproiciproducens sp. NJN-50]|uniref:hypothetical protein n=1 Tax=Acutalibacteraceae TaxID=3082771 RepID=UPI000FFE175E|nr:MULTISPECIES: hypothetical protein [Acutalibacteraceae]QAT50983.1 hypothetical protein EQM14_15080 [Caproiciproducens sp. NJN-50]
MKLLDHAGRRGHQSDNFGSDHFHDNEFGLAFAAAVCRRAAFRVKSVTLKDEESFIDFGLRESFTRIADTDAFIAKYRSAKLARADMEFELDGKTLFLDVLFGARNVSVIYPDDSSIDIGGLMNSLESDALELMKKGAAGKGNPDGSDPVKRFESKYMDLFGSLPDESLFLASREEFRDALRRAVKMKVPLTDLLPLKSGSGK